MRTCALLVLAACAHGPPILELSRSCLGDCSAFSVAMYADGYVEYHGHAHVVPLEPDLRTEHLNAAKRAAIADAFASRGFASFDDAMLRCGSDDLGALISITYRDHRISYFDLCGVIPQELQTLVGTLVVLLDLRDWWSGYYPKPLYLEPRE